MVHILGQEQKKEGKFGIRTGHHLEVGKVVEYFLIGYDFAVLAHRGGVEVKGRFPCVNRIGIITLISILQRAVRHHEHLASYAVGTPQQIMPEGVLDIEDQQGSLLNPIKFTSTDVQ
jgi:hypothetical protein